MCNITRVLCCGTCEKCLMSETYKPVLMGHSGGIRETGCDSHKTISLVYHYSPIVQSEKSVQDLGGVGVICTFNATAAIVQ